MGRAARRWLVALFTTSMITILFWASSGERNSWESAQFRVIRNNDVNIGRQSNANKSDETSTKQSAEAQSAEPRAGQFGAARARVLLMSYMRSGSTFTGDIFQSSSAVFYLYEPLIYVNDDDNMVPSERPSKFRLIPKAMGIREPPEIHNYTLDTLNCKLTDHNLRFLYALTYSKSTAEFDECQRKLGVKPSTFGKCGEQLRTRCEQSKAVVSKILRLKMWEVEKLLFEDPELKVIHLVRDPRGVYVSRRAVRYYFADAPFCARLNADASMSSELQVKYPGRILTTRYEDLARNPSEIAKLLFQFGGILWTEEVDARLINMTSNSDVHTKENVFNTSRKNSSLTASSWRQKIQFERASRLQSLCRPSMELYGYVPFNTAQDLRDMNIASFQRDYSDKFFKAQILR